MGMWFYNETEFTSSMVGDYAGFVYEIFDKDTKKIYIGKKKLIMLRTLKPLKGQKRKRRVISESDWMSYYGSSEEVKKLVAEFGPNRFVRKIIRLCKTPAEMSYYETKEILLRDALLKPNQYYNAFVGARINRNHLKHLLNSD